MADRIKNILQFAAVAPGETVALPHSLNVNGVALIPDVAEPDKANVTVTADDTDVTVKNNTSSSIDVNVLVEHWYSMDRVFGVEGQDALAITPFIPDGANNFNALPRYGVIWSPDNPLGTHDNTYINWEEIITALANLQAPGPKFLLFDPTHVALGEMIIPAGTFDMTNVVWSSVPVAPGGIGGTEGFIIVSDGTFLPNLFTIELDYRLWVIQNRNETAPVVVVSEFLNKVIIGRKSSTLEFSQASSASKEFFHITSALVIFQMGDFASLGPQSLNQGAAQLPGSENPSPILRIDGTCVLVCEHGGILRNAISGNGIFVPRITSAPTSSIWGIEDQPLFNGTVIDVELADTSLVGVADASATDAYWPSHVKTDTSGAVVTVNLGTARYRKGDMIEVKDTKGNALANNVTVNAFKAVGVPTSFTASDILGFDPLAPGSQYNPGDTIVIAGSTTNDGTEQIAELIITGVAATSGLRVAGAPFNAEAGAGTVTYQETIDGATSSVIAADFGVLRLRAVDMIGTLSVV